MRCAVETAAKSAASSLLRRNGAVLTLPLHIQRIQSLWPLLTLKLHSLALVESAKSIVLNGREVYKHIFARGALNKSITFCAIKPFHYALFPHAFTLSCGSPQNPKQLNSAMDAITQYYKYGLPRHSPVTLRKTSLWNFVTIYDRNF